MKKYFHLFIVQLIIVGMAVNIDLPSSQTKGLIACVVIAMIYPLSVWMEDAGNYKEEKVE